MLHLIKLLFDIIFHVAKYQAKHQAPPPLDPSLYYKRARSIAQYIDMASNAMIKEGRKATDVEAMLLNNGLHEDHLQVVMEKAERRYKDWFNKKDNTVSVLDIYQQSLSEHAVNTKAVVKMASIADEDHALHYSILIGFKRYYQASGRQLLYAVVSEARANSPVAVNNEVAIKQASFARHGGNEDKLFLRVVTVNYERQTVYPYLHGDNRTQFQSRQITEWINSDPVIEAEIEGEWNRNLKFCFFASDYAVNRSIYISKANINVRFSAFALDLFESERNNDQLNQEVRGLWPATGYKHPSYFGFEGVIIKVKATAVDKQSTGCIISLRLVNSGYTPGADLVVDTYISKSNIKTDRIQKGMLVKGTLWLQGELDD